MPDFDLNDPPGDAGIASAIGRALGRQAGQIEPAASENIVSAGVLGVRRSVPTDRYAQRHPGRRCHGGCEYNDEVEMLAIARARGLRRRFPIYDRGAPA